MLPRLTAAVIVLLAVLALAVGAASAHALAVSSDPPAGSTLPRAPARVTVTFGEQPDPSLSSLRILDSSGQDHTGGKTMAVSGQPLSLQVAVGPIGNGVYTVAWRTVSRVDGHLAAGTFAFGVGVAPTGAAASAGFSARTPSPSALSVLGRGLLYAGLMLLVGITGFILACTRSPGLAVRLRALLGVGWALAVAGPIVIAVDAWPKAHVPTSALLSSSIGQEFTGRLGPAIAVGAFLAAAVIVGFDRRPARARVLLLLAGVAALAAMWEDVAASHAAAAHSLGYLRRAVQWAHFAAAGLWVGGLVALLASLPTIAAEDRLGIAKRFSAVALGCVCVIAASGAQRAYDEVGSLHALVHAVFGRYVLLKAALFVALVILGALNRYRGIPALVHGARPLRTSVRGELMIVAVVLVATGILQGLAPPASSPRPPVVTPIVLNAHDFATSVKVTLEITPGTAGFDRFEARVADYDTARPVKGNVSLTFSLPARPDLGQAGLVLVPQATPGTYAASSANLSIDGTWRVTALVEQPNGSAEVPFTVTPRLPPENITVTHNGNGIPDLYTLHLPGNRSVQSYLDPGHPGALNEFHATFIGPDGQELPMTGITVTASPGGSLTVRALDPIGHFVADLTAATKGPYRFRVVGTTREGDTITAAFQIPVT